MSSVARRQPNNWNSQLIVGLLCAVPLLFHCIHVRAYVCRGFCHSFAHWCFYGFHLAMTSISGECIHTYIYIYIVRCEAMSANRQKLTIYWIKSKAMWYVVNNELSFAALRLNIIPSNPIPCVAISRLCTFSLHMSNRLDYRQWMCTNTKSNFRRYFFFSFRSFVDVEISN